MGDDLDDDLLADTRRRRRRLVYAVLALLGTIVVTTLGGFTLRDRKVYLIGGSEPVLAELEGGTRFRLVEPYAATVSRMPGEHALGGARGPARASIGVPYAPWTSQVAAPVQEGQCLIVASGGGFYEGGDPERIYIHDFSREPREVSLPVMTDVVATHPCRLPPAIHLLDTIVVIATVPCAEAPRDAAGARERILATLASCDAMRAAER